MTREEAARAITRFLARQNEDLLQKNNQKTNANEWSTYRLSFAALWTCRPWRTWGTLRAKEKENCLAFQPHNIGHLFELAYPHSQPYCEVCKQLDVTRVTWRRFWPRAAVTNFLPKIARIFSKKMAFFPSDFKRSNRYLYPLNYQKMRKSSRLALLGYHSSFLSLDSRLTRHTILSLYGMESNWKKLHLRHMEKLTMW